MNSNPDKKDRRLTLALILLLVAAAGSMALQALLPLWHVSQSVQALVPR